MDRVAYATKFLDSEYIINVQGDEPLVSYHDIQMVYRECIYSVVNCYQNCCGKTDKNNTNTIKVITNNDEELQYASRSPIPSVASYYKRQVCIYMFRRGFLLDMYGEGKPKGRLEFCEDIEILRVLDTNYKVLMKEVIGNYQSVDVPEDIQKVEDILSANQKT